MPEIAPWAFVLAVRDYNRTANYFRDVLVVLPPKFAPLRANFGDQQATENKGLVLRFPHLPMVWNLGIATLGFRILWEEATDWRLAERDGVRVMLGHCPNATSPSETGPHNWFGYLSVSDVDALHTELTARGAQCSAPTDTAYGMREVMVTTIDGHRIVFGQDSPARHS